MNTQTTPLDPRAHRRPAARELCRASEHIEGLIHLQVRITFAWWRVCVRAAFGV